MAKAKRQMGRPSSYSEAIADEICDRIANGESLVRVCADQHMPSTSVVFKWLGDDARADFADRYARAREAQADFMAQEILHIANTPQVGVITTEKPTGTETKIADMIEHRRLQVDARKWLASKLAPKKYGDKITQELGGPNGGPIVHTVRREIVRPGDPDR